MSKCHHLLLLFVLAVFCVGFVSVPGAQAEPEAVILYTANTLGKYDPCPACDEGEPVGGLARRAKVFEDYRQEVDASILFILGGGNEFLPILPIETPSNRENMFTAKAFQLLEYDLGVMLQEEASRLQEAKAEQLPAWHVITDKPQSNIIRKGNIAIGVVIFPEFENFTAAVPSEMMEGVAKAALDLQTKADLVVGLSPWGEPNEKHFVEAYPEVMDVLFGSGFGAGSGLRRVDGARTLWIRPEFNGWSVMALTVNRLPDKDGQAGWGEEGDVSFAKIKLDEGVAEDEAMAGLLNWL